MNTVIFDIVEPDFFKNLRTWVDHSISKSLLKMDSQQHVWWPRFKEGVCCIDRNYKAKSVVIDGQKIDLSTKASAKYQELEKSIVDFLPRTFSKSDVTRPVVCIYAYIMMSLAYKGTLLIDSVTKTTTELLPEREMEFLVTSLINYNKGIQSPSVDTFFKTLRAFVNESLTEEVKNKKSALVSKIINKEWSEIKIADVFVIADGNETFPSLYGDLQKMQRRDGINLEMYEENKDWMLPLLEFLSKKMHVKANANTMSQPKNVVDRLLLLLPDINTTLCTKVDTNALMLEEFKDYTLNNVDGYVNIRSGHCYSYFTLALNIIQRGGIIETPQLKPLNIEERTKIVNGVITYLEHLDEANFGDLIKSLKQYSTTDVTPILQRFEKANVDELIDELLSRTIPIGEFINFMVDKYSKTLAFQSVQKIFKYSCGTILDLIALLGYILWSDDITAFHNTDGKRFNISLYCQGVFLGLLEELDKLIDNDNNTTVMDQLKTLKFSEKSFGDIIKSITDTCIHAVGASLMRFYLEAYETVKDIVFDKDTRCMPAQSNIEMMAKMFKLAPMFIEMPEEYNQYFEIDIAKKQYLTCARHDAIIGKNPNIERCVVMMISKTGSKYVGRINNISSYNSECNGVLTDYIIPTRTPQYVDIVGYDSGDYTLPKYMNYAKDENLTVKLLGIPAQFMQQRKALFKTFADYVLHITKLMVSLDSDKSNTMKEMFNTEYFDMIEASYKKSEVPKYFTLLNLESGTMMLNSKFEVPKESNVAEYKTQSGKSKYHIDSFESFLQNGYIMSEEDKRAKVSLMPRNIDVTRQYQYAQLLSRMLHLERDKYYLCHRDNYSHDFVKQVFLSFETYYQRASRRILEIRTAPFVTMEVTINGTKFDRSTIANKRQTFIKAVKELAGEEKSVEERNVLALSLMNLIMNIDMLSASKHINDMITHMSKSWNTKTAELITTIYNDVVSRLCITWIMYASYRMRVSNRDNLKHFYLFKQYELMQLVDGKNYSYFISDIKLLLKKKSQSLTVNNVMLMDYISQISPHGIADDLYKFHFSEIDNELYFLEDLRSRISKSETENNADFITTSSTSTPTLIDRYNNTLPVLNQMLHYYKDNADAALKLNDSQDSVRVRFDYVIKTMLLDTQVQQMYVTGMFEDGLKKLLDLNNKYTQSVHAKVVDALAIYQGASAQLAKVAESVDSTFKDAFAAMFASEFASKHDNIRNLLNYCGAMVDALNIF